MFGETDTPFGMSRPGQSAFGRTASAQVDQPYGLDENTKSTMDMFEQWLQKMAAQQAMREQQSSQSSGGGKGGGILGMFSGGGGGGGG